MDQLWKFVNFTINTMTYAKSLPGEKEGSQGEASTSFNLPGRQVTAEELQTRKPVLPFVRR
jgi:hypothetical protein